MRGKTMLHRGSRYIRGWRAFVTAAVAALLVLSAAPAAGAAAKTGGAKHGGTLTVLVPNGSWPELDTATDVSQQADARILNDIDGQLFEQGASGKILPDLAIGYRLSDHNLVVTITLRHGVKFQDGTPFNAQAVAYNINRDLDPKNVCLCDSVFASVKSVTARGQYDVVIHLKQPYAPLIASFINQAPNQPESPTALQNEPLKTFEQHPVGAGPFKLVSFVSNTKVVLTRNPHYWRKGRPYLNGITFVASSSDQTDYEAILTGQAQQTTISTPSLAKQIEASHSLNLTIYPSPIYYMVLFNSTIPTFSNILVREALSYATDPNSIVKKIFEGIYPTMETFCTDQTLYCPATVPTYRGYNPGKAKQLIAEYQEKTGKPFPTITLYSFLSTNETLTEAIAAEWKALGVSTQITLVPTIGEFVSDSRANSWPDWVENSVESSSDPSTATTAMFGVHGTFTGTNDQTLQSMLSQAETIITPSVRAKLYRQIFNYMDKMAYAIPLYQSSILTLNAKNVVGYVDGTSKQVVQDDNISLRG
jgi:peptide/nickel transport system substrate-binding protein